MEPKQFSREERTKALARLREIEKEAIEKQKATAENIISLMRNFVSLQKLENEGTYEITGPLGMMCLDCFTILKDERLTALFSREFLLLPPAVWKSIEQAWAEVKREYCSTKRA